MLTHLVLRRIPVAQGQDVLAGTKVDASQWANTRRLESAGYLRRLRADESAAPAAPALSVDVHEVTSTIVDAAGAAPPTEPIQVDFVGLRDKGTAEVRVTVDPGALPKKKPKASKKKGS